MAWDRTAVALACAAVAAATLTTACSSASPAKTTRDGRLKGEILMQGGPLILAGTHRRSAPGEVRVFTTHGRLIARAKVKAGGGYEFALAPGRYEVVAAPVLETYEDCAPATGVVRAGKTTTINAPIGCDVM